MDISLRYQSHWFVTREWSSVVLAERIRSQEEVSSCLWYRCLGVSIGIRSFSISTRIIFYALRVSVWYQAVCDCYLQPRQHEADQCDGVYKMHLDMEGQNVDNCDDWQNRKTWPLASCQDPLIILMQDIHTSVHQRCPGGREATRCPAIMGLLASGRKILTKVVYRKNRKQQNLIHHKGCLALISGKWKIWWRYTARYRTYSTVTRSLILSPARQKAAEGSHHLARGPRVSDRQLTIVSG